MDKGLVEIKEHYERAWVAICENDFKKATKIIYNDMSIKSYDRSIQIEYLNLRAEKARCITDEDSKDLIYKEELQNLITKVNKRLIEESGYTDEEVIDGEDLSDEPGLELDDNFEDQF